MSSNYTWVRCKIERSGFNSERRFEVSFPGQDAISGVAYLPYLRRDDLQPVGNEEPSNDQRITGQVRCRVLRREEDKVWVLFPGTDAVPIPKDVIEVGG